MYKVIPVDSRFHVIDEQGNIMVRSCSQSTAEAICRHYNSPGATTDYPIEPDSESLLRRAQRAQNRADLARLAEERKAELLNGISVEQSLTHSELIGLNRVTRGESYR